MGQGLALGLGEINGHVVGRVLKEALRRAMVRIRNGRMTLEVLTKPGYDGISIDVFTSIDTEAQEVYLRTFLECFPNCGVIGEEDLRIPPKNGCRAYLIVDPLDGTKAYIRRQSHGVGTMVALVIDEEVVCAYIGDINTEEVYGYRPGSDHVHRITQLDLFEKLTYYKPLEPGDAYVLLRDPVNTYDAASRRLVETVFKSHLVDGGSIGIWMARLWKREVAAAILRPGWQTPWDLMPIIGISRKLGYIFCRPTVDGGWERFEPPITIDNYETTHDILVVHYNDAPVVGVV